MRVDGDVDAKPCRMTAEGAGGDGKPGASFLSQWAEEGDTSGINSAVAGSPGLQRSWGLQGGRGDMVSVCWWHRGGLLWVDQHSEHLLGQLLWAFGSNICSLESHHCRLSVWMWVWVLWEVLRS